MSTIIETERLRLRPMNDADLEPFLAMAADPDVTRYVSPVAIPRASAEAAFHHYREMLATKEYGYWTIDVHAGPSFAGVILLQDVNFTAAFTPAIEVGWLLPSAQWGNGYATEGARAVLEYAFSTLRIDEVVALTAAGNVASQRVMERLGMTRDPADDFNHPLGIGTSLERCVLYRIRREGDPRRAERQPS